MRAVRLCCYNQKQAHTEYEIAIITIVSSQIANIYSQSNNFKTEKDDGQTHEEDHYDALICIYVGPM